MKKHLFILMSTLLPLLMYAQERIMVITDPHVLPQELFDADSQSFREMMDGQRKMLDLSEPIWRALMDTALKYKPEVLLIPGDLTKDSEKASHELIINSLQKLKEAGIKTLAIPGNHDVGGNAYSYMGAEKTSVDNMPDTEWESAYSWIYEQVLSKDTGSHSYVAEPIDGITIIGIDGSDNNAATGKLSDASLAWVLAQADAANAKGNTIIAMSHWQLLEHVDKQGMLESSCRFEKADAIRDSLIHHGVRLLLTGHFHINSISTYRDTTGLTNDSIVEISTGSPITYPCPYRWLTLSADRQTVDVETDYLTAVDTIADLYTYSREWMRVHATNMIPQMTLRAWAKADQALDMLRNNSQLGGDVLANLLEQSMPTTDSAKIDLVQRHLGQTAVEMYLLHSDANEPEHPEADSLAMAVYDGMESMIKEMTNSTMWNFFSEMRTMLINGAKLVAEEPVQSLVEDMTNWRSDLYYNRTDDLKLRLKINGEQVQAVEQTPVPLTANQKYDILGRPIASPQQGTVYIQDGKKILR